MWSLRCPYTRPMSPTVARGLGIIGLILYLGVGFFYLTSGLLVPGVALVLLWLVWLAGLWLAIRWFRTRPQRVLLVAVGAAIFWFIYVQGGSAIFGWTA